MAEIVKIRKAIFLDNSEEQYKDLGYPHRNIVSYRCDNCNNVYSVDDSIDAKYCYHCGAEQNSNK